jgi:predicted alpha/beta superfamily hydrolase
VIVYTPPDYNTGNKKYPVVYLLHGANDYEMGWTQSGMANTIMDNLIADKKAVPAIIVMPFGHEKTGSTGRQPEILALQKALGYTPPPPAARGAGPGGPGFGAPGGNGWTMEKEMLDYVIPYVEKEFRVIKDKDHRAIMGYSMGGFLAIQLMYDVPLRLRRAVLGGTGENYFRAGSGATASSTANPMQRAPPSGGEQPANSHRHTHGQRGRPRHPTQPRPCSRPDHSIGTRSRG